MLTKNRIILLIFSIWEKLQWATEKSLSRPVAKAISGIKLLMSVTFKFYLLSVNSLERGREFDSQMWPYCLWQPPTTSLYVIISKRT